MRFVTAYRVSVRKFDRMCAAGLFDDEKVELLGGILTMMASGSGTRQCRALVAADQLLRMLPSDRWTVRDDMPVRLGTFWKPLPDIAVVRGIPTDYLNRTPGRLDIALIIEVSDTTYRKDTGVKLRGYGTAGYRCTGSSTSLGVASRSGR